MSMPIVLLDTIGYSFYADGTDRRYLPADRFEVRLVTDRERVAEATGPEIASVVAVDKYDYEALSDAVRFQVGFGGRKAERLIALTERMLMPAALLRSELGLPGATPAETILFRDKVLMKEHLRDHGIAIPEFAPFSAAAVRELFDRHGKLVVKPRMGAGAVDIHILTGSDYLEQALAAVGDRAEEFEVEQFIDGELFHVDSVVQDGRVLAATVSRYLDETTSFLRLAPTRSISVSAGPLNDRLLDFNQKVIASYPNFSGVTHHEMFASADTICFCEIAGRAGGGGVIAGFRSRTGVDLDEAATLAQLGEPVPTGEVAPHLVGFVVIYSAPGRLSSSIVIPDMPWVLEAQLLASPGQELSAPVNCNDAVAIVSVRGDTEVEVVARMEQVVTAVRASIVR